jgi:hypothetical protein
MDVLELLPLLKILGKRPRSLSKIAMIYCQLWTQERPYEATDVLELDA